MYVCMCIYIYIYMHLCIHHAPLRPCGDVRIYSRRDTGAYGRVPNDRVCKPNDQLISERGRRSEGSRYFLHYFRHLYIFNHFLFNTIPLVCIFNRICYFIIVFGRLAFLGGGASRSPPWPWDYYYYFLFCRFILFYFYFLFVFFFGYFLFKFIYFLYSFLETITITIPITIYIYIYIYIYILHVYILHVYIYIYIHTSTIPITVTITIIITIIIIITIAETVWQPGALPGPGTPRAPEPFFGGGVI